MLKLISDSDNNDKILVCNNLKNDIIFTRYKVSENDFIEIQDNQFVLLFYKGKILDVKSKIGVYAIKESEISNNIDEEWKNLIIRDSLEEDLSIIFLNLNEINNKYNFDKPIKIITWKNDKPIKKYVKLHGEYRFIINNPKNLLKNIIGLRNHFSKQELIEKIRNFLVNYIKDGINQFCSEYKLDINDLSEKYYTNLKPKIKLNEYEEKLLEYGIQLTYFDINNIEINKRKIKFF